MEEKILVWPDGLWCWEDEYCEYNSMHSDDFVVIHVLDGQDPDQLALIACS